MGEEFLKFLYIFREFAKILKNKASNHLGGAVFLCRTPHQTPRPAFLSARHIKRPPLVNSVFFRFF
jgi:hypothetical protein